MLTRKQLELLLFIQERVAEAGVPPSFDEMKEALDLKSKSGIHRLIMALEERGFIRRLPNRARALEVVRLPEAAEAGRAAPRGAGFQPSVIEGGQRAASPRPAPRPSRPAGPSPASPASTVASAVQVPLMGRIAAGVPISAIQTPSHTVSVPADMLSGGEHFALEVRGDSMVNAGIIDSDTVVIRRQDSAESGDIVVALIDDEEATLKRLRRKGAAVALEAENPAYETRTYTSDRVRIQGRLVGLIRRY